MKRALVLLAACAGPDVSPPASPTMPAPADVASGGPLVSEANPAGAADVGDPGDLADPGEVGELGELDGRSGVDGRGGAAEAIAEGPEVWLKGSTHVHARASGDSSEPNGNVIAWYEEHHYDFIVLTDHNRVSELAPASDTRGQITLRDPHAGLIVFSGIELTHNPIGCLPVGDPSRNCRIHVNLIGPTARRGGRLEWAERRSHARLDMYRAALNAQTSLGGLAQINHPQWLWGMTPELLAELARRGTRLVEVSNAAFSKWDAGDASHLSTEALWDAALARGATIYGTASDDAHDYHARGRWPPGGGWIVVHARRDPRAILAALTAGHFYASSGVVLEHAEIDGDELVVAVAPSEAGKYTIDFIENGQRVATVPSKVGRRAIPATGYLRAVVTRDDGKRAWVQPVRK